MADAIEVKRSGFFSQLLHGRPTYALKPAAFTSNFFVTMMAMSDTSVESHRAMTSLVSRTKGGLPIKSATGSRRLGIDTKGLDLKTKDKLAKIAAKQSIIWGVSKDTFYYKDGNPNNDLTSYHIFHYSREGIFRFFKLIDMSLRLPAMILSGLQLMFERGGWDLQTALPRYLEEDNPTRTALRLFLGRFEYIFRVVPFIVSIVGLGLNVIGTLVLRPAVFACKIAAEAVRAPLAAIGGIIGIVFGGFVAAGNAVSIAITKKTSEFNPWYETLFIGMQDGIRPFAPELANALLENYVKVKHAVDDVSIRRPFEEMPTDSDAKSKIMNIPWFSIAMFTVAVIATILLSTVTFGFGGLLSMPLLPYLFHATGMGALGPMLSKVTMAAMGLMGIGGIQAAFVGIGRGIQAFLNDLTTSPPAREREKMVLGGTVNNVTYQQQQTQQQQEHHSSTITINNKNKVPQQRILIN